MDADQQTQHSATDIITYIGVPLAVLGVLPILYNTVATLAALSRIRRLLRHCKLPALTRSDVVNRVIEVELPRYAVRPMDRFMDRDEYWTLSRHPSNIPGGSWTTFNWRTNVIGHSTQRLEYVDQLRQPQVEVAFDELVCYLLDLGAVPDPHGWRLLRSSGLWTPVGCALMRSPDGRNNALTIAPLDGSDGHLSLAVTWAGPWTTRDCSYLPPYWVRLPPLQESEAATSSSSKVTDETEDSKPASEDTKSSEETKTSDTSSAEQDTKAADEDSSSIIKKTSSIHKQSIDSTRRAAASYRRHPITCQISTEGIVMALSEDASDSSYPDPSLSAAPSIHSLTPTARARSTLYVDHLLIRGNPSTTGRTDGMWFASAATAYGTTSQTILWNYKVPDEILTFARRETVPCGVLVLLGVADEASTPEWMSESAARQEEDDRQRQIEESQRKAREHHAAIVAESRMSPQERSQAVLARMRRDAEERMREMRERSRLEAQRKETRILEALQSPRWDNTRVAKLTLTWLVQRNELSKTVTDVKEAVGGILHRMVLDGEFTGRLCRMLDLWKGWADNGGMRRSDLSALEEDTVTFAFATLLVAIIKDTSAAVEGTVSMDLQECLRTWRIVRLG
ncbi:hypothetical protein VTJ49DRAFT_6759 [Mycothermus thermophilus]|uniref:Uncharacterized protein n=1 Tax=Humicola insolens TaxID=85995 RepID=A0ABR3VJV9_HUMIN